MLLLFDVGNTHTHVGLADARRAIRKFELATSAWCDGTAQKELGKKLRQIHVTGAAVCSVVPKTTPLISQFVARQFPFECLVLTHRTVRGIGIDYPKPETIGPDRLANAVALKSRFGAPAVAVDFGTAVTFDVVDKSGNYVGGIIAPGLAVMTDYLHEKTALLPKIKIREPRAMIGKNTEQAMLIAAVHGYRGLIRELVGDLKRELKCRNLPVVATGGYAKLMAAKLPEITAVEPFLTLDGLRLVWQAHHISEPVPRASRKKGGERPCAACDADF